MTVPQPPYPLHSSIEHLVDPQYKEFYNKYVINLQQTHYQPVEASRSSGVLIPGGGDKLKVAKTEDFEVTRVETEGDSFKVRVFTPLGETPSEGWPVFLYMHGGGWVLGNIDTENVHCTNWCSRARCVVVSVDYRLAPEHPYPAAFEDTWEAYLWTIENAKALNVNLSKFAAGGSSAGGNLTAALTHKINAYNQTSKEKVPELILQVLIVPVCDNTATPESYESWKKYEHTATLSAEKMMWYRVKYLPEEEMRSEVYASPIFASEESFKNVPPALFAVAGIDVLSGEAESYAAKLKAANIPYTYKVFEGVPHVVMAMNGVLDKGKELVTYVCDNLKAAFWS